jgi:hypothetical protein
MRDASPYVAGEVYAMSGATARHNLIAGTVFARCLAAESGTACRVFMSDMRLEAAGAAGGRRA